MRKLIISALAVLAISLGAVPAAHADGQDDALQVQVDAILVQHPGGVQTSRNTISWNHGATILTLATGIGTFAVGSCATGSYCAYNGLSLIGSKISFSACPATVSTSALPGTVRSIANARSSGTIQGQNSGGTTLTTVSAGGQVNSAPAGVTQLRCF